MIAKAILDMISLPTAAPLSTAQSAGQPSQTFSDSLLAASKSFQQVSSTSDGGSKSGHRQKTDSDDAKTPDAVPVSDSAVGAIVVLPTVPQQSERTTASVAASESPLGGSTTTDRISTGVAGLFAQSLKSVGFTDTGSSVAQGTGSTSIAPPAGIQSSFTSAPTTGNIQFAGLAKTQTSAFQTGVAQAGNALPTSAQSNFTPVQAPAIEAMATTPDSSNAAVSQTARDVAAAKFPEIQTSVDQSSNVPTSIPQSTVVEPKITQAQMPSAEPAPTQNTSNDVASQQTANVTVAKLPEIQCSVTQTNSAEVSDVPAILRQPAVVESKITQAQMSSAEAATAQNASDAVDSLQSGNVTVAKHFEIKTGTNQTNSAEVSDAPAVILHPSVVQSNRSVRTTVPVERQSNVPNPEVSQADRSQQIIIEPVSVQSNVTPANNDLSQSSSKLPVASVQEMTAPDAAVTPDAKGGQDSSSTAALNALSNAVQNLVANGTIDPSPVPVLHATLSASAKDVAAQALKADTTAQTDPQPAVPDQTPATTTTSVTGGIADQLAASPLSAGQFGVNQIGVSSLKPAAATKRQAVDSNDEKDSGTERTGLKKSAEPETEKGLKSSSQDATASGDQGQGGNDSQAQVAVSVPVNFTVHPAAVIVAAQNAAHVATNHTSSSADAAGIGVKTADNAAMNTSTALPQTLPVINTAKLIQSMGQSEMRVGMRSNEFGNISISTSTTHDQVSAQISLEHGELAKTLAAQLPEMQARLGGNHPMDVRIDMNGAATGQGTGTYGGTSHGSQDQSSNGRQQAGNMAASSPIIGTAEKQFSPVALVMPTGYAHLDIRV